MLPHAHFLKECMRLCQLVTCTIFREPAVMLMLGSLMCAHGKFLGHFEVGLLLI